MYSYRCPKCGTVYYSAAELNRLRNLNCDCGEPLVREQDEGYHDEHAEERAVFEHGIERGLRR